MSGTVGSASVIPRHDSSPSGSVNTRIPRCSRLARHVRRATYSLCQASWSVADTLRSWRAFAAAFSVSLFTTRSGSLGSSSWISRRSEPRIFWSLADWRMNRRSTGLRSRISSATGARNATSGVSSGGGDDHISIASGRRSFFASFRAWPMLGTAVPFSTPRRMRMWCPWHPRFRRR
jgi:hypothetical protein